MAEPACRVRTHSEGVTMINFDSQGRLVTCGGDAEVRTYLNFPEELEDPEEFDLSTSSISAMVCYRTQEKEDVIALATDNNNVVTYTAEGTINKLLTRFTSPVTSLAVTKDHTLLAAGSSEFTIKVLELHNLPSSFLLVDHEAPVLCVTFDPDGEFLASSSCDGTVRVWSMRERECVQELNVVSKSSEVSNAPSLCQLAWGNTGKSLAVPVGSEVKVYTPPSWKCSFTLSDKSYHKEVLNVVKWSPCGQYLACGDVYGHVSIWHVTTKTCKRRMKNENQTGITALEWDPRGRGSPDGDRLVFADSSGYVGVFEGVYPSEGSTNQNTDPLAEDSLLMEGIPADDIFGDFDAIDEPLSGRNVGGASVEKAWPTEQAHKRVRLNSNEEIFGDNQGDELDAHSDQSGGFEEDYQYESQRPRMGPKFSEKLIEEYQLPWQPSATPKHLQHRFMVYNLVGVVRCHDNEDTPLIEVDFHNSGTHHSFSLPNPLSHSMAALSEEALVLACERMEDLPSQLQCVHFNSWDVHKGWTIPLPSKESITAVTIGNGWIAVATNRQLLRLFTVGGVQREVISIPGHVTTLAGWGPRLSVVYQVPPCSSGVYGLTVWILDIQRKKQLHPPHTLPISRHAQLRWIGFSEEGCLLTHDSKGMVRIHGNSCYGGLSWIPVLETNKQLGNKNDHYFIVGMTHQPDELRCILCKDSEYPPVHPRPVMSSLLLHLPLCEPLLERTEHEREYIQTSMIKPPARHCKPAELVQRLMKMFALSCKSGREFKACEIASMMPDQQSVDLAMTYASRSQHLKLARQISELSQQKFQNEASDSDLSEDEDGGKWTNQNADDHQREELSYTKMRMSSLKKGPSTLLSSSHKTGRGLLTGSSKFSRYMEAPKRGNSHQRAGFGSHTHSSHTHSSNAERESLSPPQDELLASGGNETAELFSDSERETPPIKEDAESAVMENESETEDIDVGEGIDHTPKAFGDTSIRKRPNPFKLTTPVSKRLSAERRVGFLDNISARIDEERREEAAKKNQKRRGSAHMGDAPTSKTRKKKTSSVPQKNLKNSFFKNKANQSSEKTLTSAADEVKTNNQSCDQDEASVSHDQDAHDQEAAVSHDENATVSQIVTEQETADKAVTVSHDQEEHASTNGVNEVEEKRDRKLTTKEKLASFAFKATS